MKTSNERYGINFTNTGAYNFSNSNYMMDGDMNTYSTANGTREGDMLFDFSDLPPFSSNAQMKIIKIIIKATLKGEHTASSSSFSFQCGFRKNKTGTMRYNTSEVFYLLNNQFCNKITTFTKEFVAISGSFSPYIVQGLSFQDDYFYLRINADNLKIYSITMEIIYSDEETNLFFTTYLNNSGNIQSNTYQHFVDTLETLTATPNTNYQFVKWADGNSTNPRLITVGQNETYTAIFQLNSIYNGNSQIKDLYIGTTPVQIVYIGDQKIYEKYQE